MAVTREELARATDVSDAVAEYEALGWVLTYYNQDAKGPVRKGWQDRANCKVPPGWEGNVGVMAGYSGLGVIDIDDIDQARVWLELEHGVDLDELLDAEDAVQIISGKPGRAKLIYRLTEDAPVRLSVKHVTRDEAGKKKDVINFRCSTRTGASVQDAIPPSIHPEMGQPYRWGGRGDYRALPTIPRELEVVWDALTDPRDHGDELTASEQAGVSRGGRRSRQAAGPAVVVPVPVGAGYEVPDSGAPADSVEQAWEALQAIDPDVDREAWVHLGMAAKAAGLGLEQWDEWSARGEKYAGPQDTAAVWNSIREDMPGGIGPGTLFHKAREAGWTGGRRALSAHQMFGHLEAAAEEAEGAPEAASSLDDLLGCGQATGGPGAEPAVSATVHHLDFERRVRALTDKSVGAEVDDLMRWIGARVDLEAERERLVQATKKQTGLPVALLRRMVATGRKEALALNGGGTTASGSQDVLWNRQAGTARQRFDALTTHLGADVPATIHSLMDLSRRYIWVASDAGWWDRLTQQVLRPAGFNGAYSQLVSSWRQQDAGGGPVAEGEEGPPMSPSDMLLSSTLCSVADGLDFWPGVRTPLIWEEGQVLVNMWRRPPAMARRGDVRPWLRLMEALFPESVERWYLIEWMAQVMRHQQLKINHNLLIGGAPRIGKDSILQPLIRGLGERHNVAQIQADKLGEPYEDFFVGRKLVVIQEVFHAGVSHKKLENKLKPFGAAPPERIELRRHGRPSISQRNVGQLVAFTNYRDALALSSGASRWYAVWAAPETPPWEQGQYRAYYQWLDAGGAEAVLYFLEQVDLKRFDPGAPAPATAWREGLQALSEESDPLESEIRERIHQRIAPFDVDVVRANDIIDALSMCFTVDRETRVSRRTVSAVLQRLGSISTGDTAVWCARRRQSWRPRFWAVRTPHVWADRLIEGWSAEYEQGVGRQRDSVPGG